MMAPLYHIKINALCNLGILQIYKIYKSDFFFHVSCIYMHSINYTRCMAQSRPMTAVSHSKIGIMLYHQDLKINLELTYESTIIQARSVERLFTGGELHILG